LTIEKLTESERFFLGAYEENGGTKALRIIDAQAAVIETLRNELVCRGDAVKAAEGGEHLQRLAAERAESEAAALRAVAEAHVKALAAANARVAELESGRAEFIQATMQAAAQGAQERIDAANARADAAEKDAEEWKQCSRDWRVRAESAESERDEWRAKCEAAERDTYTGRNNAAKVQELGYAVQRAESEAAALRAEVSSAADRLGRAEQRETVLDIASELRKL
jgi:hypothetical protein